MFAIQLIIRLLCWCRFCLKSSPFLLCFCLSMDVTRKHDHFYYHQQKLQEFMCLHINIILIILNRNCRNQSSYFADPANPIIMNTSNAIWFTFWFVKYIYIHTSYSTTLRIELRKTQHIQLNNTFSRAFGMKQVIKYVNYGGSTQQAISKN